MRTEGCLLEQPASEKSAEACTASDETATLPAPGCSLAEDQPSCAQALAHRHRS